MSESYLPFILAAITALSLNAYVILGGADFGGGVWDLLARGPRKEEQRELIAEAIGPIWEANHVWLIFVVVLLFTCFPRAFSTLAIGLHIPISLMLVGIVLRGSAFTFRSYDATNSPVQRYWGRIFAVASTVTPIVFGICVGAWVSGALALPATGGFAELYVRPWFTPFALSLGGLTLACFAFLAATYLTVEAGKGALQEDFRRKALWAALSLGFFALLTLFFGQGRVGVTSDLFSKLLTLPLQLVTGTAALTAIGALWTRRYVLARVAATVQISVLLWGWFYAQFPALIPGVMSIEEAAAPAVTLRLTLFAVVGGMIVLIPSLFYLFKIFKSEERQ